MNAPFISNLKNGRRNYSSVPAKKATIAIADDEPALRLLLNEVFQKNYQVVTLAGGKDCLEYVNRCEPEVLITDLNMPDISGLETIKEIRKNPNFDRMAIIVLSGAESSLERIKCLDAGADDFMVKPFNPRELEARVKAIRRRIDL